MAAILARQGYWTQTGVKVELTKTEKRVRQTTKSKPSPSERSRTLDGGLPPTSDDILRTSSGSTCYMPKSVSLQPPGFDDLSVDETIEYLQSL